MGKEFLWGCENVWKLDNDVGDGEESLACCSPCGLRESDMTERLNWVDWRSNIKKYLNICCNFLNETLNYTAYTSSVLMNSFKESVQIIPPNLLFSSVQSLSHVHLCHPIRTAACQGSCPSPSPGHCLDSCPLSW